MHKSCSVNCLARHIKIFHTTVIVNSIPQHPFSVTTTTPLTRVQVPPGSIGPTSGVKLKLQPPYMSLLLSLTTWPTLSPYLYLTQCLGLSLLDQNPCSRLNLKLSETKLFKICWKLPCWIGKRYVILDWMS